MSERLGEALDTVLDASLALAAAVFVHDQELPSATRRLEGVPAEVLRAMAALAARAQKACAPCRVSDLDAGAVSEALALGRSGARAALALPLDAGRLAEGAIVLLFADPDNADEATLRFLQTVARITALAATRDRADESERRFQEELTESGRMATLGLYTASVAHELRGPAGALVLQHEELQAIAQQLSALAGPFDTASASAISELSEIVSDMGIAVDRMRETVSQLTTFGRREPRSSRQSVAHIVHESLSIARPHLDRRGVLLVEELDADCFALVRRDHLGQVVLNLVFNAADAALLSSPPRVWVRVRGRGDQVVLVVEDNGPGVPPEAVSEIFKPFYTTKQRGEGTGLGLKIVQDVVTSHGGHIELDRGAAGGAVFRVSLPRTAASQPVTASMPAPASGRTAIRKVLLIEDDPVFARTVRRALRPHDVRVTSSASEAEIALLDPGYDPDLVVCDVFLPGVNGNVLHARLCERRPNVAARFVFVTGGALGKSEADYLRGSGCPTLLKPVDVRNLIAMLDENATEPPLAVRTLV